MSPPVGSREVGRDDVRGAFASEVVLATALRISLKPDWSRFSLSTWLTNAALAQQWIWLSLDCVKKGSDHFGLGSGDLPLRTIAFRSQISELCRFNLNLV